MSFILHTLVGIARQRLRLVVYPSPSLRRCKEREKGASLNRPLDLSRKNGISFLFERPLPLPGWHMLELKVESLYGVRSVRISLDTGDGWDEENTLFLALKSGRVSKRLCFLPYGLKAIRVEFDTTDAGLRFSHFRFIWVTRWFARKRLLQRLASSHWRWRDVPTTQIVNDLKVEARKKGVPLRLAAIKAYEETFSHRPLRRTYAKWIEDSEAARELRPDKVAKVLAILPYRPLISILLPVFNSRIDFLRECIDSVLAQSYANFQLCIADDASTTPVIRDLLQDYAEKDQRVEVFFRSRNGHISATSNSALELAKGEYVALLDHDDKLGPNALFHVLEALHRNRDAAVLYSDEDKIDENGIRYDPHFKPDWNPDLILSQNYVSHLGVYRTDLVRDIGGFREGFDGSQDHDLLLRCVARIRADQVVHIPHVAYHWRATQGSTALNSGEKEYTSTAGLRAVQDFLDSQKTSARVSSGRFPNTYRVHWPLPAPLPRVSLMVPTRDGVDFLRPCVDAMLQHTDYPNFELIILDNQSSCKRTLAYMARIEADPRVRILRWNHRFNYSAINNFGASQASGELLGLINNDVEPINNDWLAEMVSHACRPEIGCVGAKLYYPNDTIQHGGVFLGLGGVAGHGHKHFARSHPGYFSRLHLTQNLSAVTAACLLVRKSVFEEVGGLEEEHLPVAFNDVDFCLRVREAGYRNLWTPYAELYHHESVSRGADTTPDKRRRAQREAQYMRKRWGKALDNDPAYNPNLTLVYDDFSLR